MSAYTCHKCLDDFSEDDIVWADEIGQLQREIGNNFAWCVSCLPAEIPQPEYKIIDTSRDEVKAFDREITIEGEGVQYWLTLRWYEGEGYSTTWRNTQGQYVSQPTWADNLNMEELDERTYVPVGKLA